MNWTKKHTIILISALIAGGAGFFLYKRNKKKNESEVVSDNSGTKTTIDATLVEPKEVKQAQIADDKAYSTKPAKKSAIPKGSVALAFSPNYWSSVANAGIKAPVLLDMATLSKAATELLTVIKKNDSQGIYNTFKKYITSKARCSQMAYEFNRVWKYNLLGKINSSMGTSKALTISKYVNSLLDY
jgi:uncharacterized protein YktA (UPF0223 family)